ncbi:MAG: phosphoglycerate dehydrogenase [Phycisphaerales bacterium]
MTQTDPLISQPDHETSVPLHKIRVVLLEGVHPDAERLLSDAGYTVESHPKSLSDGALIEAIGEAHMVGIRSRTRLTREVLSEARRLWAVGCFCIGTDQVDLPAAADLGIAVFNAPFSNTRSVAEKVICEIIALHRRLFDRSAAMHAGKWDKSAAGSHEVRARTLGIVGYGRIGSQVSVLGEALGMRVLYHDVVDCLPLGNATRCRTLEELLECSDVVTLHVPDCEATRDLIDERAIERMRDGAFLINNSRGNVVRIGALAAALRSGKLGGAAVDVFPSEPSSNAEPFDSELRGLGNVILTPHIGGSTAEAQRNIGEEVASKLVMFMNNGSTTTSVNVPEVQLPRLHERHHRILHYHRNVPGVLSKLHGHISEVGANVAAQYLQTNARHGYTILDVDRGSDRQLVERLRDVPETIRVRAVW